MQSSLYSRLRRLRRPFTVPTGGGGNTTPRFLQAWSAFLGPVNAVPLFLIAFVANGKAELLDAHVFSSGFCFKYLCAALLAAVVLPCLLTVCLRLARKVKELLRLELVVEPKDAPRPTEDHDEG